MGEVEENVMGERRSFNQESLLLLDHRVKQLENERLPNRMLTAESTLAQVQAEVKAITEILNGIKIKLDLSVKEIGDRQDKGHQSLRESQLKFMSFIKGVMWVGAVIGTLVAFAPTLNKIFGVLTGG